MIDVVVVTFDTREITLDCVSRLTEHRVVVVDNGSTDATAEAIRERFGAVAVLVLERGVGFAEACNRGAALGHAPLVLFLNSDVLAPPGAVATLRAALEARPGAVAAGGRLVDPGTDHTQLAYAPHAFPTLRTLLVRLSGLERLLAAPAPQATDGPTVAVDQPAGACLLVRRSAFAAVGGFDERFWFWYEDVDLARRLRAHGPLLHVPGAAFEHLGGGTFAAWGRARGLRSRLHGILRYAEVHFDRPRRVLLGLGLVACALPRIAAFAALSRGDLRDAWAAAARGGLALATGREIAPLAGN